jgi:hypothetical protein
LAVVLAAVILCIFVGGALAHTTNLSDPGAACTTVERIGVGFDLALPLVKTGARAKCDFTTKPAGQWLTVGGWGLQLLAWGFATLFIAGFTSAIRRT